MLQQIFTPWRLKWYPRLILFGLFIGFLIGILYGEGAITLTGRLGGDYPAFYGPGRIASQGGWDELYNAKRQLSAQQGLYQDSNEYLHFAYPPFVALLYWPLSLIDFRMSYVLHTLLMVIVLFLVVHIIRPLNKHVDSYFMPAFTLLLIFYPVLRSVIGGQNTPITLLIIALTWRLVAGGRDFSAGIILGLLLYKPQFGLPLIGLFLLSRHWRVVCGSTVTALVLYGIGVFLQGPDWISKWYTLAQAFSERDAFVNRINAISWLGFFQGTMGKKSIAALILGWGLSLLTAVYISWVWWRGGREADLSDQLGVACLSLILMSPHIMYYDLGLLFFTCLALIDKIKEKRLMIVGIIWLSGFSQTLSKLTGFSPLFIVTMLTWLISIRIFIPSNNMTVLKQT